MTFDEKIIRYRIPISSINERVVEMQLGMTRSRPYKILKHYALEELIREAKRKQDTNSVR